MMENIQIYNDCMCYYKKIKKQIEQSTTKLIRGHNL